jgi:RNA polymerase sigma-70 factor (ECF subfamily)
MNADVETFEACRSTLEALAYRMLGDVGRAEDMVQEAWLRWQSRDVEVDSPRAYLLTIVTRLCLNELDSARARREQTRSGRLPEPIDLRDGVLGRMETRDQISMAFLVALQRLTPAERAVLLLHDVFDFSHVELAALLARSEAACRQLLKRAREHVVRERGTLTASRREHARLLRAFLHAAEAGDVESLKQLLADDAVLVADAGPRGGRRYGRVRNLPRPIVGARKIAAFAAAAVPQRPKHFVRRVLELNGDPAIVTFDGPLVFSAVLLSIAGGKIHRVFVCADPAKLGHVATEKAPSERHAARS